MPKTKTIMLDQVPEGMLWGRSPGKDLIHLADPEAAWHMEGPSLCGVRLMGLSEHFYTGSKPIHDRCVAIAKERGR